MVLIKMLFRAWSSSRAISIPPSNVQQLLNIRRTTEIPIRSWSQFSSDPGEWSELNCNVHRQWRLLWFALHLVWLFFARAFHRSISQSFHFHPKADSIETGLERKGFYFIFRYFYRRRNQKLFENEMVRLYRIKGFFFGEICLIFWSLEEEKVESRKITILCEIFIKVIFMKSQKFSRAAFKYFLIKFRSFPTCTFENFMQPGEDFKTHSRERMIYGQAHN